MKFRTYLNESNLNKVKDYFEPLLKDIPKEFDTQLTINGLKIFSGKRLVGGVSMYDLQKKKVKLEDVIKNAKVKAKAKPKKEEISKNQGDMK